MQLAIEPTERTSSKECEDEDLLSKVNSFQRDTSFKSCVTLLQHRPKTQRERKMRETQRRTFLDYFLGSSQGHTVALAGIACILLIFGMFCWRAASGDEFDQALWMSWGLFFDPGTQTGLGPPDPLMAKVVAMIFSISGFVFNLVVLGIVVEAVRWQLDYWKHTRGWVVANGHTLMLGWSDKTLFTLRELLSAYEEDVKARRLCCSCCRRSRRHVVIMAERPVAKMEEKVWNFLTDKGMSPHGIYFREGDCTERKELVKVSATSAEDIIIMGSGSNLHTSDEHVLQCLLALTSLPGRAAISGDVLAELQDPENAVVVSTLLKHADGIVAREAVNRMLCLSGIVPAIGECYVDLVSFTGGNQLYWIPAPSVLIGKPFEEIGTWFARAVVMGCIQGGAKHGSSSVIPSPGYAIKSNDQLLLLSTGKIITCEQGGHSWVPTWKGVRQPSLRSATAEFEVTEHQSKVVIIIGCPSDVIDFLVLLDLYLSPGSEVHILSERGDDILREIGEDGRAFKSIAVKKHTGHTTSRRHLEKLPLERADTILILSERADNNTFEKPTAVDSRSLQSIVSLNAITGNSKKYWKSKTNDGSVGERRRELKPTCAVVCELLHFRTQELVEENDDISKMGVYFHSNALEAAVFAMAAEDKVAFNSLMLLLQPGNDFGDLLMIPSSRVLAHFADDAVEEYSFMQLYTRVLEQLGCVLLGWKRAGDTLALNPQDKDLAVAWKKADSHQLLVLRGSFPDGPEGILKAVLPIDRAMSCESCRSIDVREIPGALPTE